MSEIVTPEAVSTNAVISEYKLATRPQRLAAFLLDFAFINIVSYAVNFLLDLIGGSGASTETLSTDFTNSISYFLIIFLYFPVFTALWAATPGKRILKIKVVLADGGKLTPQKIFLREVIGRGVSQLIFGYAWILFNKNNKNVWDFIADTLVVKA